jgi:hypothetical protein
MSAILLPTRTYRCSGVVSTSSSCTAADTRNHTAYVAVQTDPGSRICIVCGQPVDFRSPQVTKRWTRTPQTRHSRCASIAEIISCFTDTEQMQLDCKDQPQLYCSARYSLAACFSRPQQQPLLQHMCFILTLSAANCNLLCGTRHRLAVDNHSMLYMRGNRCNEVVTTSGSYTSDGLQPDCTYVRTI